MVSWTSAVIGRFGSGGKMEGFILPVPGSIKIAGLSGSSVGCF